MTEYISKLRELGLRLRHPEDEDVSQMELLTQAYQYSSRPYSTLVNWKTSKKLKSSQQEIHGENGTGEMLHEGTPPKESCLLAQEMLEVEDSLLAEDEESVLPSLLQPQRCGNSHFRLSSPQPSQRNQGERPNDDNTQYVFFVIIIIFGSS